MRSPDEIILTDLTKQFEYTRMCKEIEECTDIKELKLATKCYVKLYLSTLEAISNIKEI